MANSKNITFDQLQSALTRVKNSLDKKANTSHGNHVPKTETANNARFLRNDNTWQTITPVNIGAADRSHNHTSLTGVTSLQFAAGLSDSAVMKVTTDSGNTYLDFEMNDDVGSDMYRWRFSAYGTNGATPYFNLMTLSAKNTTSARLTVNGDVTASSFTGNATSATKLQSARALKIGNTSKNFDGTGNVTWTLSDIGAAASSHTHSYLPLSGGTISNSGFNSLSIERSGSTNGASIGFKNSNGVLGFIGMTGTKDGGLIRWSSNTTTSTSGTPYTMLDTGNYKTYVTPANIGAANASHGTHVTYGGNGSATTVSRSDHTHSYIPLGGSSSITGNLEFSNSGTTVRGVIGAMGDNDYWRIVGGATASNSGYLEIATADDASEPIYVRQYGSGKFGTLTRTATLLDASGNTSFPGTVTAPTFKGALNGNASTATKLQTARKINDVSFDGSADIIVPIKFWKSTVEDNNNKPYHRILTSGVVTSQWTDKVITVMASSNYAGGAFGIFRVLLRTNGANADSSINIEWITRKGFSTNSIVANFIKTGGATQADIFYKSAKTHASVTWTILGEGDRSSGNYYSSWTKINTAAATTEVYTETEMKALKSYTSTMIQGTDVAHVNTSAKLNTARSINGTNFDGTANITTANWGTARTLTVGNAGKSVNGSGNISWSIDEIGALKANKQGNTDVNTLKTTGRYFIKGTPTNTPTSNHGVIDVAWDIGTPYQIFYPDNANTAYKRNWNSSNNTWNGWTQLKFTDTNTWRGVQNNLTSDATDQSLSAAQGKALKGLIDGKAAASHTHNYAAASHEHSYLNIKSTNTITSTSNDIPAKWGPHKNSVHWYTTNNQLYNQPSQYGFLLNIANSSDVHQIWMTQSGGNLSHRGGNAEGWNGTWRTILDSDNYTTYAAAKSHGNHVPATQSADNKKFLRNDNTWQTVTPANIGAATSNHNHDSVYLKQAGGTVSGNLAVSGTFSVGGKKITINSSAPSSPAVGDIWIKI